MDGFALRWREYLAEGTAIAVLVNSRHGDGIAGQSDGACSIMTARACRTDWTRSSWSRTARSNAPATAGRRRSCCRARRKRGQHVRHAGEDVAAGQRVLEAGARLDEEALLVLRGIGIGRLAVRRRPRLALACTGRELVDTDGASSRPGRSPTPMAPTWSSCSPRPACRAGRTRHPAPTARDAGLARAG